jgi:hypothetical protein
MANLAKTKTEVLDDPLGRGYEAMTFQEVIDSLHTKDRQRNKTSLTGSEVLNSIDAADWATRTDAQKRTVFDICHLGTVNPWGVEATLLIDAFDGSTGATITALQAARVELIHRVAELGLGNVRTSDIQKVRA